jgi:hypothetical protein
MPPGSSTWVVASPHRVRDASDGLWRPFGRRHALVPGSQLTMCGRDAQVWRVFVDLPYDVDQAEACLDCSDPLRGRPGSDLGL